MQLFAGKKKSYSFVPWESVHFWLAFTRIVKQIVENNRHFFFHLYTLQSQSHLQCLLEIFAWMDSCMRVYMRDIFVYHPWLGYRDLYRTHFSTNTDIFIQKQKLIHILTCIHLLNKIFKTTHIIIKIYANIRIVRSFYHSLCHTLSL